MSADRRVKEPAQRIPGNRTAQAGSRTAHAWARARPRGRGRPQGRVCGSCVGSDPRALRICKEQQLRACLSTMPHPWDERNVVWQRLGKKKGISSCRVGGDGGGRGRARPSWSARLRVTAQCATQLACARWHRGGLRSHGESDRRCRELRGTAAGCACSPFRGHVRPVAVPRRLTVSMSPMRFGCSSLWITSLVVGDPSQTFSC